MANSIPASHPFTNLWIDSDASGYHPPGTPESLVDVESTPLDNGSDIHHEPRSIESANLLVHARELTSRDRAQAYDIPERNFARIAALWNVYLANREAGPYAPIQEYEVGIMMALMKIGRLQFDPSNYDSWVDAVGYLAVGWDAFAGLE